MNNLKIIKKFLCLALSLIFVLCPLLPASAAKENGLRFKDDGIFRIMNIADTHFTDVPFEESIEFIERCLDDYQPDLVIFGGDNIKGWFDTSMQLGVKAAIDKLVAPLEKRNIPFSFTYGNHDWEAYLCPKSLQSKMYAAHSNCIMPVSDGIGLRAGDGYILIKDSKGEKNIFNIWLFDSGTKIKTGSTYVESVGEAQIKWYEKTCRALAEQNGGKVIPAVAFQHFPVQEVADIFDESENGVKCGDKTYVLKDGFTDGITDGVPGRPNDRMTTHLNKTVELPSENSGEYSAWVCQKDIIAAFFGHAHVNDYCGITRDGIILGSTLSAGGFNISSRFRDENGEQIEGRGLRIIDINENSLLDPEKTPIEAITTFSVYYSDYFTDSVEKYPSKYKAYDEHDFGEWLRMEFEYLIAFIMDLFR